MIRLLLTEACLLGTAGAIGAVAVAFITLRALSVVIPVEDREMLASRINAQALVFTAGLGLAAGFLFGLFPSHTGRECQPGQGADGEVRSDLRVARRVTLSRRAGHDAESRSPPHCWRSQFSSS